MKKILFSFIAIALFACTKPVININNRTIPPPVVIPPGVSASVFIFGGQSNGTDYGSSVSLPYPMGNYILNSATYYKPVDDISNNGTWQTAHAGWNTQTGLTGGTNFGVTTPFCFKMAGTYGKYPYIIPTNVGGTPLAVDPGQDWNISSSNELYKRSMVDHVLVSLPKIGSSYTIKSYVWLGCESDCVNATYANACKQNLINFINKVRLDLGNPNLPFVIVDIQASLVQYYAYVPIVRQAFQDVKNQMNNVYLIDTSTETRLPASSHYTDASYLSIGYKLADLCVTF